MPAEASARSNSRTGTEPERLDVLIVEDYVPEYRRRFFELLEGALSSESIRMAVAVGTPPAAMTARRDGVASMPILRSVPTRTFSIGRRKLTHKRLHGLAEESRLVVVDQALRHLENYSLLRRRERAPRVALWGHGMRQVQRAGVLQRYVDRRLTSAADWFFAYTERGADYVSAGGFPRDRITVVHNTIDVRELGALRDAVSAEEQDRLRADLDLPARNVCLYVGALDASKRVDFLLEASAVVASRVPGFTLVVAGDGDDRVLVERWLVASPWLRYVGRADAAQKARLGAVSDVLLMPGRVGLVAVDSFALRTPILTTRWPYHAPEVDYLVDGVNARFSGDSTAEFAELARQTLLDPERVAAMKAACGEAAANYSLEAMVSRFAGGIADALNAPRR